MRLINYIKCILFSLTLILPLCAHTQESVISFDLDYEFRLYGQKRYYNMLMHKTNDGGVQIDWTIFSYQKWLKGSYFISPNGLISGSELNFIQPVNGRKEYLKDSETFGLISVSAFDSLKNTGSFVYNNTTYRLKELQTMEIGEESLDVFYVIADIDDTKMWIWNNRELPIICRIDHNPLEINFSIEKIKRIKQSSLVKK